MLYVSFRGRKAGLSLGTTMEIISAVVGKATQDLNFRGVGRLLPGDWS